MLGRWGLTAALAAALLGPAGGATAADRLATVAVQSAGRADSAAFDGVVEAVRQTVVAAQVPGAVVAIDVRPGDRVHAGQTLARLDARAAEQTAAAGAAQVQAARAAQEVAQREFERQRQLYEKRYISQAALERAEAQLKASQAQVAAQLAQAGASRTQSGFFVVRAPYAGVVAEVPVTLGDMAMPGRALLTLYDPAALRVTASVPQAAAVRLQAEAAARVEFPNLPDAQRWATPTRTTVLPTVDPGTHTAQVRLALPAGLEGVAPGMFARAWLPVRAEPGERLYVPAGALVRRAELVALYVIDPAGRPVLRQVRTGRSRGDEVEILAGVAAGERVALDPQAAARPGAVADPPAGAAAAAGAAGALATARTVAETSAQAEAAGNAGRASP